jgi:hypothetical protein
MASLQQISRHARTHSPESNETHFHGVILSSLWPFYEINLVERPRAGLSHIAAHRPVLLEMPPASEESPHKCDNQLSSEASAIVRKKEIAEYRSNHRASW